MQDIDLDKLFNEDTPDQGGDGGQPPSKQKPTNTLSGLAQASGSSKTKPRPQKPQSQVKPRAMPNDSKQQGAGQDTQKKDGQKLGSAVSMSPEGRPILEHDTREPIEKKLDELNEILDINLTDEIERTTFAEATELPSVPEGSEVLKKKIEEESTAEKQVQPPPQPVAQQQNMQSASPSRQPSPHTANQKIQQSQQQVQKIQQPRTQNLPQQNNQNTQQTGTVPKQRKVFTGPPTPQWPENASQSRSSGVQQNQQPQKSSQQSVPQPNQQASPQNQQAQPLSQSNKPQNINQVNNQSIKQQSPTQTQKPQQPQAGNKNKPSPSTPQTVPPNRG